MRLDSSKQNTAWLLTGFLYGTAFEMFFHACLLGL